MSELMEKRVTFAQRQERWLFAICRGSWEICLHRTNRKPEALLSATSCDHRHQPTASPFLTRPAVWIDEDMTNGLLVSDEAIQCHILVPHRVRVICDLLSCHVKQLIRKVKHTLHDGRERKVVPHLLCVDGVFCLLELLHKKSHDPNASDQKHGPPFSQKPPMQRHQRLHLA